MSSDFGTAPAPADSAMTPAELRDALQLRQGTFYNYQARGKFVRFELEPRIGPHRYSRTKVRAYLDGVPAPPVLKRVAR